MVKTYSKQSQSGEGGISLIDRIVNGMGFIWHVRRVDHGIDGEIELVDRDRRLPLNRTIFVQSKARQRFPGEDQQSFHYLCHADDVEYWLQAPVPVILVCSHPETNEAWWAPVSVLLKDPNRRKNRRIDFDKRADRFDHTAAQALLDLGVPVTGSLYVPTDRRPESLTTNLLRVERYPETIWATPATVSGNPEAGQVLRRNGFFGTDWTVLDRTVCSFRRTDEEHFRAITDGTAEALASEEWAQSKSRDTMRDFVRLLNQTLTEQTHRDLRRHPRRHYLYFRPTKDLEPRALPTGKSRRGRVVFQAYPSATDPSTARHFRHHAVDNRFIRIGGTWFLELNPTYHYTSNGYQDLQWGADLVKGMKRREKNGAVRGLVEMWAGYLAGADSLFENKEQLTIRFGALSTLSVDRGIDERDWQRYLRVNPAANSGDLVLFEQ